MAVTHIPRGSLDSILVGHRSAVNAAPAVVQKLSQKVAVSQLFVADFLP
jgi:hypothetical protein